MNENGLQEQSIFYNIFILCADVDESQSFIENPWRRQLSALNTYGEVYKTEWNIGLIQQILIEMMTTKWKIKIYGQKYILIEDRKEYKAGMEAYIQNLCENLKQPICSNSMQQQKEKLDIEMEEFWRQLMQISKWKYQRMKKNINNQVQFVEKTDKNKVDEQQERKVWDLGRSRTTTKQQCIQASGQQQHKVWI
jgi:hypothetical protein